MEDITHEFGKMVNEIENIWSDALYKLQQEDEYSSSSIFLYAKTGMERLIRHTFNLNSSSIESIFTLETPQMLFDKGAEECKNALTNKLLKEGNLIDNQQLWSYFKDYKEKEFGKAHNLIFNAARKIDSSLLDKYMYFTLGVKSLLEIFNKKFPQEKFFDLKEETAKTKMRIKELNENINGMDRDLHGEKNLMNKLNSEINDINLEISKIKNDVDQMTFEIKGSIHKKMLPSLGEVEELLSSVNLRLGKTEEGTKSLIKKTDLIEKNLSETNQKYEEIVKNEKIMIGNLEKELDYNIDKLRNLANEFLKKNDEFLIVKKDLLKRMGNDTSRGLLDVMEYCLNNYSMEIATSTQRIPMIMSELKSKIESHTQYNTAIPQFWIRILQYVHDMSCEIQISDGEVRSIVDANWIVGIEEMLGSIDHIFTDKDALKAMRIVSDIEVPPIKEREIWVKYTEKDERTKKALYNAMKEFRNNPTYLKIAIPSILSSSILSVALHHRDIPEFIWFCSVAYDEMWNLYKNLFQEMIKRRIEKG